MDRLGLEPPRPAFGEYLRVLRRTTFGSPVAARLLAQFPRVSRALCWSTIVFECAGPLLIVLGPVPCLAFIACGLLFHTSNALTMGLNKFFWGFGATYPAVLLISLDLNPAGIIHRLGTAWVGPVVVVVGWAVLIGEGWWLLHLIRHHGRLRARLKHVEAALGAGWPIRRMQ